MAPRSSKAETVRNRSRLDGDCRLFVEQPPQGRGGRQRQTRRRFGGRHPLCGIGVISRIEVTANPTACKARSADSRPEPGPLTSISSVRMPCSMALRPASSAATCAAYGVDLREPLKPWLPADDHAIVFPWASVIVIIVLLKVAFTCAVPEVMFFRSRRRRRGAAAAVLAIYHLPQLPFRRPGLFLPAGDRASRALARPRVRVRTLPPNR